MINLNPFGFTLLEITLTDIKANVKNPRKINAREKKELKASINKFGLIDKPILNKQNKDKTYDCIGGHQRLDLLKQAGVETCLCYVPTKRLSQPEVEELLLRVNKNTGTFDNDLLRQNFKAEDLLAHGWAKSELDNIFIKIDLDTKEASYPIVPKMGEKYGCIIIVYESDVEEASLRTILNTARAKDYKSNRVAESSVITFDHFQKAINERITFNNIES